MYRKNGAPNPNLLEAALRYAARGVPVFPLEPGGKRPMIPGGFHKATTDAGIIRGWWRRWPLANIGAPTGSGMGRFVLDVDADTGGFESLKSLEEAHGALPATTRAATGGGGAHLYFTLPAEPGVEIRNGAGDFAPGLDIRGTGGYVVLPPSTTEGAYTWESNAPAVEAPAWLVDLAVKKRRRAPAGDPHADRVGPGPIAADDGEPFGEGRRNAGLCSVGGRLRRRGAEHGELLEELLRVNRERCSPPLPDEEVGRIAASVARYAPGEVRGADSPRIAELLRDIERRLWAEEFKGTGGGSDRDILVSLIKAARRYGTGAPDGVRVSIGVRSLALAAATSKPTAIKALTRLEERGLIRRDNADRSGPKAAAYVLLTPRAKVDHSHHRESHTSSHGSSGKGLRGRAGAHKGAPLSAPRLRWSGPHPDDKESRILRLGKGAGAVVDVLEAAGGSATVADIAETLQKARVRDLRRRIIGRLEDRGIVTVSGELVSLVEDWREALDAERETAGEIKRYRMDLLKFNRESKAYRQRYENRPDESPSREALDAKRAIRESADGFTQDLRKIPEWESLTDEERAAVPIIAEYERRTGRAFDYTTAEYKKLFYSGLAGDIWPTPDGLQRIKDYVLAMEASGPERRAS